jgi:hypothetical protein
VTNLRIIGVVLIATLSGADAFGDQKIPPTQLRFFETNIRPLLADHCWTCHGADEQKGDLRLDSLSGMLRGGESGESIVPGNPDESLLMEAVRYESYEMPPSGKLNDDQVAHLEAWIRMGAPWPGDDGISRVERDEKQQFTDDDRRWWAIQGVPDRRVPEIEGDRWSRNPIDRFVLRRLQDNNLSPAPEADRRSLARRLYFDLHGLPPTPGEIETFLADDRPDAYERLVERLLASPRYGERWARHWLDLVRYADSDGYRADHYRENAWRYRDYVIRALNDDKPYNRFVQEQLAGDELFPGDPDALIATGFLTHGIYEYNNRDVVGHWDIMLNELTDVTGDVFLGVGMQCARCHDHKFDPILQRDYFRLRAFFEPIVFEDDRIAASEDEWSAYEKANRHWLRATKALRDELDALERPYRRDAEEKAITKFPADIQAMIRKPTSERTPREEQLVRLAWRQVEFEYTRMDKSFKPVDKEKILSLRRQLATFDRLRPTPLPIARAVSDVADSAPPTVIPKKRVSVEPGFLTLLQPEPAEVVPSPGSKRSTGRRSSLARWLTDPDNPLTTRVMVNRVWQHHFGRGLASNPSDLGRLGGPPSHPELLDWLTKRFLENGWSLKPLHRLIVCSATYRQSTSHPRRQAYTLRDANNRWYWRADTRRLDAEQVRDAILAVTGQLDLRCFGPGVLPDRPRRSIFTRVMRNARDPLLDVFDLPLFFSSTAARDKTTSPIQSLLLINSQTMLGHADELARAARRRAAAEQTPVDASPSPQGDGIDPGVVESVWHMALGRAPSQEESRTAIRFVESQAESLRQREGSIVAGAIKTGTIPYRNGQSIVLDSASPTPMQISDDDGLHIDQFTIEAYFQVRSVYDSGSVRTVAAKWNGNRHTAGWAFGVTGKGSRRKPQTLVMQLFGNTSTGDLAEAAVFSDQHVALNKPYYAAASVRMAGDQPGSVDFFLKDLSDDDEPMSRVRVEHRIVGGISNSLPITLGRRGKANHGLFDGLIDDVRLSRGPLEVGDLLLTNEGVDVTTIGYWQFEAEPGIFRDSSRYGRRIETSPPKADRSDPHYTALVDLCHVLMNSNEFLYVD